MPGIAGKIDYAGSAGLDGAVLKGMLKELRHDADETDGFWISEHILLGSVSVGADEFEPSQPIVISTGEHIYALVFTGEIYNISELRTELAGSGVKNPAEDTGHVLLESYIRWGEGFLAKLIGVFSLAIRDPSRDCVVLARDSLGVKPLLYYTEGGSVTFATHIKAIFSDENTRAVVKREGLAELFALGPMRTPGFGVFEHVSELPPGTVMTISRNGSKTRRYRAFNSYEHEESFEDTLMSVKHLVTDSIERQLDTDCVYLLSGGLDSSIVSAAASRLYGPIRTFSLDYVDNDKNFRASSFQPNTDAPWVKRVSKYLKTEHETIFIDTPELVDALRESVTARGYPGMADIDTSLLLFSKRIRSHAKVGVTGECADEMFGGYPWFYRHSAPDMFPWAPRLDERVRVCSATLLETIDIAGHVSMRYKQTLDEVPMCETDTPETARHRVLSYLTITRWLPVLLERQNAMGTSAGLILRAPFSDHRIAEYMWNVPWSMKYKYNREKGLLRQAMTGLLPDDALWRKKSPFPKTHNPNYIEAIKLLTRETVLKSSSPIYELVNIPYINTLFATINRDTDIPWFGQLMNAPQLLAYLVCLHFWFTEFSVSL